MAFSEVFTGLQTGTINGQENPIEVPWTNKFSEVQKYVSLTNHINDAWVLALSSKKWGTLSEDQKKSLTDASAETATFKTGYDAEQSKKQLDELAAKGMKVNELSCLRPRGIQGRLQEPVPAVLPADRQGILRPGDRLHQPPASPARGRERLPGLPAPAHHSRSQCRQSGRT